MALVTFNKDRCKGCELCISVCPKGIVLLKEEEINKMGFHPAGVDNMELCIGCAFCAMIVLIVLSK